MHLVDKPWRFAVIFERRCTASANTILLAKKAVQSMWHTSLLPRVSHGLLDEAKEIECEVIHLVNLPVKIRMEGAVPLAEVDTAQVGEPSGSSNLYFTGALCTSIRQTLTTASACEIHCAQRLLKDELSRRRSAMLEKKSTHAAVAPRNAVASPSPRSRGLARLKQLNVVRRSPCARVARSRSRGLADGSAAVGSDSDDDDDAPLSSLVPPA